MTTPAHSHPHRTSYRHFMTREDGAVTIDWVVLASLVVGLAIAFGNVYRNQIADLASDMNTEISAVEIQTALE